MFKIISYTINLKKNKDLRCFQMINTSLKSLKSFNKWFEFLYRVQYHTD